MVNWFFHTYQLLMAHKRWATYCLLGLIAVFVFLALNINYEEDIARFLPRNEQSERYNQVYQGLSGQNRIVVVFSGNNTDSIELAMDQFETILSENDEKHLLESMQIRVE